MAIGDLGRDRRGRWAVEAPTHCANAHPLGSNRVLVGTAVCDCGTRHQTWFCRACEDITYGPPLGPTCRVRTGPDER